KVRGRYWPDWVQNTFGWVLIVVLLAAGGLVSLYVSYALPNLLSRLSAREQLESVRGRIGGVSSRIDSRLRVLISVEAQRLDALLYSRNILSPEYADVLSHCKEGIADLEKRVDRTTQLDTLREQFEQACSCMPGPTFIDRTDKALQRAADHLRKPQPVRADYD